MDSFVMHLVVFGAYVAGGLVAGGIFERVILSRLRRLAQRTKWEGDEIIIEALRRRVVVFLALAGVYAGMLSLPLGETLVFYLKRLFLALVILLGTAVLARMAVGFVNLYLRKGAFPLPSASIFTNLTKLVVFIIGVLIILQSLGISITPILTALGVGGLAAALALQPTLANLFSGLQIVAARQLHPGDYIKLESGEEGYVADITWRNTTIRSIQNNMIIVPNARLASIVVTNYYQPQQEMNVVVPVGVSYASDLERVEKVTIEVAKEVMLEVPGGVPDFAPVIRYHTFGDSSIIFNVVLRAREYADQYLVRHEFIKRLHRRYQKEGIVIPFPIRMVHLQEKGK